MARAVLIIVSFLVAGLVSGCGGEKDAAPPPAARAAVASFVSALKASDGSTACALVAEPLRADLRVAALGAFRPTASTQAKRLAQVKATAAAARTCPGAMGVLARDLGSRADRLLAEVTTLPLKWLAPNQRTIAVLGREQWAVERRDGNWRVTTANAISDALP